MKQGIIDIGSNTVRLVIYKVEDEGFECIVNKKHFIQLIGTVKDKTMSEEGVSILLQTLEDLKRIANLLELDGLHCFATEPLRAVEDADAITALVRDETGLQIEVLAGKEEARLGVIGARYHHGGCEGLFVDLGGGSMEASLVKENRILHADSVKVGSVSLTNKFVTRGFPSKGEMSRIKHLVDEKLGELPWLDSAGVGDIICMGGTARAMFSIHGIMNVPGAPHKEYVFDAAQIKNLYKAVLGMRLNGLRLLAKHCPGRMFTFVPGVAALSRVAKKTGVKTVHLSTFGVREGFLIERVLGK